MAGKHMPRSLTARLAIRGLALTGAIFLATIYFSNRVGREAAVAAAQREALAATDAAAQEIEGVLGRAEESVASLVRAVSETEPSPEALDRLVTRFDAGAATEHDPGAVFATLNRGLCRQNDAGMYVTAVCGVLDLDARTLSFSAAGHEPPVLVRGSDGRCEALETEGGRVLGMMEGGDYPVSTIPLAPGDALVSTRTASRRHRTRTATSSATSG